MHICVLTQTIYKVHPTAASSPNKGCKGHLVTLFQNF